MKIGIIGSGEVGRALARGFAGHGHQVMTGTNDKAKIDGLKEEISARKKEPPGPEVLGVLLDRGASVLKSGCACAVPPAL